MLGEYKVNRCTRQCFELKRPLKEGEWYYSVIIETDDEEFIRRDYSAQAWTGPPDEAIGWWKKRMPTADSKKLVLAPPEVLLDLLRQMERFPEQRASRYLLALMLMRRKLLRPVSEIEPGENQIDKSIMAVEVVADGSMMEIPVCQIKRSETESLREGLNELLYCEASPEDEVDES